MAKKSRRTIETEKWKLYRIHREYVRRNALYRKQYEEYQRLMNAPETTSTLMQTIANRELTGKWGLIPDDRPDPDQRLSPTEVFSKPTKPEIAFLMWEHPDAHQHQMIDVFRTTFAKRDLDGRNVAGMAFLMYYPEENPDHPSYIALNLRWSKRDLMETWEDYVDRCLADRRKAGLKQEVPKQRHSLDQYVKYLRAYDLRQQRLRYKKIDLILFPKLDGDEKRGFAYCRRGAAFVKKPPLLPPLRAKGKRSGA